MSLVLRATVCDLWCHKRMCDIQCAARYVQITQLKYEIACEHCISTASRSWTPVSMCVSTTVTPTNMKSNLCLSIITWITGFTGVNPCEHLCMHHDQVCEPHKHICAAVTIQLQQEQKKCSRMRMQWVDWRKCPSSHNSEKVEVGLNSGSSSSGSELFPTCLQMS